MIDLDEIREEIERVEQLELNYTTCSKLAILYSILDRNTPQEASQRRSVSYSSSEFMNAVYNAPIDKVLEVINEHMEIINALYPKEYKAIINKIKEG